LTPLIECRSSDFLSEKQTGRPVPLAGCSLLPPGFSIFPLVAGVFLAKPAAASGLMVATRHANGSPARSVDGVLCNLNALSVGLGDSQLCPGSSARGGPACDSPGYLRALRHRRCRLSGADLSARLPQLADWVYAILYFAINFTAVFFCRELFKLYDPHPLSMRALNVLMGGFPVLIAVFALDITVSQSSPMLL